MDLTDSPDAPEEIVSPAAPVTEAISPAVVDGASDIEPTYDPVPALEDRVPVGSTVTRTKTGWSVRIMYGGQLRLTGDGETVDMALLAAGV